MRLGPWVLGTLVLALAILPASPGRVVAEELCTPDDIAAGLCVPPPPLIEPPPDDGSFPPVTVDPGETEPPPDPPPTDIGDGDDPPAPPVIDQRAARAQLYRNGLRGVAYVSTWQGDGLAEPATIDVTPVQQIPLDGDGTENAWGNVYPVDITGDGRYGFVHFNGLRVIRVYDADGQKLWEDRNPAGRTHRSPVHRDTMAVLDTDDDGRQEIVHCWASPTGSSRLILIRDAATGSILRSLTITGETANNECQMAAIPVAGAERPILVVSRRAQPSTVCATPYVDQFSRTTAFDLELNELWDRQTCAAGHYVWPLDEDADGRAEAMFVGKYLFDTNGEPLCTLEGWGSDHIDSMVVTDLDPATPGLEVAAVGTTGVRFYQATGCLLRWSVHGSVIVLPQLVAAAQLALWPEAPAVLVTPKSRHADPHLYRLGATGAVLDRVGFAQLSQNANIDGARSSEDLVGPYGQVVGVDSSPRLTASWYWHLQSLTATEQALPAADRWAWLPLIFDLDHDGRDEIIVWGRKLLVVGRAS